ncbi:MAG: DUF3048 domain-containing protein [Candidatus Kerfeldbacteria bacterium]|nr:DUF3048 domain-containing protein [Candidatus Kerfeldbacteria bacterium]
MPTAPSKETQNNLVWGKRKNKKWLYISIAAVIVVAAGLGIFIFKFNPDTALNNANNANDDGSTLVRRASDGVYVDPADANRFPLAVIIENLTVARPQSGLAYAQVVYEALAEGGITRFLAIFTGDSPAKIGPVRSARPYFIDWVLEYGALFVHAGGSPKAIADIQSEDVFDLNQFYNAQYFFRDYSRNVASEHTLYTDGEKLAFALRDLEADAEGDYDTWKFKDDNAPDAQPTETKTISINFSSFSYSVEYTYDWEQNDYVRFMAGEAHLDADGSPIRPRNVIVMKVKTSLADEQRLDMDTIGEGEAIVFRDGSAVTGTWKKEKRDGRTYFYDATGAEIKLNAGSTWIEVVPTDREVTYN